MPKITIEVYAAGERLQELADAILRGQQVLITHLGEPVAMAQFRGPPDEKPPAAARDAILQLLGASLEYLRERLPRRSWCMH